MESGGGSGWTRGNGEPEHERRRHAVTRFARVGRAARNHKPTIEHERLVKLHVALPDGRPNGRPTGMAFLRLISVPPFLRGEPFPLSAPDTHCKDLSSPGELVHLAASGSFIVAASEGHRECACSELVDGALA